MSEESEAPFSLSDCCCNICMDIFLEPVTLPCHHTLCNACFQLTVEKASLCCPFCRRRVSSWARYNTRRNTLINMKLWQKIQKHFPEECQRRINGQNLEEDVCIPEPIRCLSKPGELRQEYEAEITRVEAERQAYEQEEKKATEEYIQRLLAEEQEEQRLAEEKKAKMAEQVLLDEKLAQELSFRLNSSGEEHTVGSQSPSPSPSNYSSRTSGNQSSYSGNIKKYLSPKLFSSLPPVMLFKNVEEKSSDSFSAGISCTKTVTCEDGGREHEMPELSPQADIGEERNPTLEPPMSQIGLVAINTFKTHSWDPSHLSTSPVNDLTSVPHMEDLETFKNDTITRNRHLTHYSKINTLQEMSASVLIGNNQQDGSSTATCDLVGNVPVKNKNHSDPLITKENTKRKSQAFLSEATMDSYLNDKRRRTFSQTAEEVADRQQQLFLEEQFNERYNQEKQDRLLALKLQKEMDKEQKTLNRKKGSPNEYQLRPQTSQSVKEFPNVRKHCKRSKPLNNHTEREQYNLRRGSLNENRKPKKFQTKLPGGKGSVLSSDSKDAELLPDKQKTILQMFKRSATK